MNASNLHRLMSFGLAAALALAAAAAKPEKAKKHVDPNPYAGYGPAMAAKPGDPMAVEWHNKNDLALKEATAPEALKAHVKDAAAAKALLGKVKGAYSSDPMALTVAAAVTQQVMKPCKCPRQATCRALWSAALLETAAQSKDAYVQMFCLDQLRWCGLPAQAEKVGALAGVAADKSVKDFADWVARELAK
ncbi:MAG: hypothetical protein IJ658_08805 [Kiritimatiellae bacterium]|nr:hypothetical protein [Kiritimatiellia bacterium]